MGRRPSDGTSHGSEIECALGAAVAWLAYAGWEWLVLVKSPEANIRVDLLLIWPVIGLTTLWALVRAAKGWWSVGR